MIVPNLSTEDLKKLPLRAIVALGARCARRVEQRARPPDDHPEKERCRSALANAVRLAENFANNLPCSSADSVVQEVEAARVAAKGDFERDMAMGGIVLAARAAANARHALDLFDESARSHSVGQAKPDPLGHLADLTADLAARNAFTAAFEAGAADWHSDSFIRAAIEDYERLLRLDLGRYPEAGEPIDPSSQGPLGPLGREETIR